MQLSVYLFSGEDLFSAEKRLKRWKKEFEKKHGDLNFSLFEGETMKSSEFHIAVSSAPFLAEKRLIVIRNFLAYGSETEQKRVTEMLNEYPDHTITVFFEEKSPDKRTALYKKIAKIGHIETFNQPPPAHVERFVENEIRARGGSTTNPSVKYLISRAGTNLFTLSHEIEKLALFARGQEITQKSIDLLVSPHLESSVFRLTDLLAEKNPSEALKVWGTLVESGEEITKIFYMIVRHFRILIQILSARSVDESLHTLGLHPYVAERAASQCKNFSAEELRAIYDALFSIEVRLKTGGMHITANNQNEFLLAIEKFILEHCKKSATKNAL